MLSECKKHVFLRIFKPKTRPRHLLRGTPFSSILGSISDPEADLKIGSFFSTIFMTILLDFGVILGPILKDLLFRSGFGQISNNLKTPDTFVKIKGSGIYDHSENHEKPCSRSR